MKKIILGLTGASGGIYFLKLAETLRKYEIRLHVIASDNGADVLKHETGVDIVEQVELWRGDSTAEVLPEDDHDMFSAVASGSYKCDAMVVIPCSMSTVAAIAAGVTDTLIRRAADVMIKEGRRLVVVPRETPLSQIHLRNLYELSKCGVTVLPAMPAFYTKPETVSDMADYITCKVLDSIGFENQNFPRWEGRSI
ncbi:MAG: UbiX family flavin prenyltransferase [Eubacteriales bacterium]|nr:UbiX family flavin prenyltransferase [Eubacteriales bacterium]